MAYVAVKGGKHAIQEAEQLLNFYRLMGGAVPIEVRQIREQMRLAVDKVMGEGSLYDPDLSALALKQAEGDAIEASFLIRAFRSTLPRNHYSLPVDSTKMEIIRRISASFKDIPGGQFLGPTRDYTKRMLNFDLIEESEKNAQDFVATHLIADRVDDRPLDTRAVPTFSKIVDLLRKEGLVENRASSRSREELANLSNESLPPIDDITRESIVFPASRSMRLQTLARGETGAMMALAYSSNRGYGHIHPTLGELRVGYVTVRVPHPLNEGESIAIGKVMVTEADILARMDETAEQKEPKFSIGYGLCFGHNEIKAISMGTLDRTMEADNPQAPAEDDEFVLYHIDGIEASGFVSHWKLPHYVDFQAELNRVRSIQNRDQLEADESGGTTNE